MRYFITQVLVAAAIVFAGRWASAESLHVMTWNIRYNNPDDGENAWPHRKDWVAEIVLREKIDIAGFQEVTAAQLKDLRALLPDREAYGVGRADGKAGGEAVPVFVRKSRIDILDRGTFWLSPTPERIGSKGWDAALPRIASWVKVRDRRTKETWYVLNTHFDHKGDEARCHSAELVVRRLREQFADHPVLVLGDFNATPRSQPIETLVAKASRGPALFDAYRQASKPPEGPNSTWNGFKKIVPNHRIDYIFASQGVNVRRLEILADQKKGRFPSDHLPVVAEVESGK